MKFSRQELITLVNRIFPPSSTAIHQPGVLLEEVRITHPAFPASWFFDGMAMQRFDSGAGGAAQSTIVPSGFFWWVPTASVFFAAGGTPSHLGISLAAPNQVPPLNTPILQTQETGWQPGGAIGLPNALDTAHLQRPMIIPQGMRMDGFRITVDALSVTSLILCAKQLKIGEPFPSL